jgi:hypothetical protein
MDNTMLVQDTTFRLSIVANVVNKTVFSLRAQASFLIAAHTKMKTIARVSTLLNFAKVLRMQLNALLVEMDLPGDHSIVFGTSMHSRWSSMIIDKLGKMTFRMYQMLKEYG